MSAPADLDPRRWRVLALLALAVLGGMSLWFTGSVAAPQLVTQWGLPAARTAWITSAVQLGFVAGTALVALTNLADVVPNRWLFAVSAVLGAVANAGVALSHSATAGLACRALTGLALAGVYPPAMKMASTWFKAERGLAVGTIVGALTVGSASPWLVRALAPTLDASLVVWSASAAALVAALLVGATWHDGPYPFAPRPFHWGLVGEVFANRRWRLATGGYLGHMFELYAAWSWLATWMAASQRARGADDRAEPALAAFVAIAAGSVGCAWGGRLADRHGRAWLVTAAMAVSATCALLIGATFGASWWVVLPVAIAWGASIVADSPQFSVMVTESVESHAVGTALSVQVSLGFLLTMVSIQLVPPVAEAIGWAWALAFLAVGPVLGIASIRRLVAVTGTR